MATTASDEAPTEVDPAALAGIEAPEDVHIVDAINFELVMRDQPAQALCGIPATLDDQWVPPSVATTCADCVIADEALGGGQA